MHGMKDARRRSWMVAVSIGLGVGAVVMTQGARGSQRGAAPAVAVAQPRPAGLERFTAPSDGHPMAVWARRPANPRGAILLVHGLTWSARPDFDLQVPGLQRSVMTSFASQGFAAYAVDLRGYGETPRDATGWMPSSTHSQIHAG